MCALLKVNISQLLFGCSQQIYNHDDYNKQKPDLSNNILHVFLLGITRNYKWQGASVITKSFNYNIWHILVSQLKRWSVLSRFSRLS